MENKNATANAATAYGKTLPSAIKYDYTWEAYQTTDELVAAKDELTLAEQVKIRNTERQQNARQKALQKAMDDAAKAFTEKNGENVPNPFIKPTIENDEQLRLKDMYKVLMSSKKYSEEQARHIASQTLGITWAE